MNLIERGFCWLIHAYFSYVNLMKFNPRLLIGLGDSYVENLPALLHLMHLDVKLAKIKLYSLSALIRLQA